MIPKDSIDFYPTPAALADRMISSVMGSKYGRSFFPGPILEPSAGDGAIAKAVERAAGIYRNHDEAFATLEKLDVIEPDTTHQQEYADAYARWKQCLEG